MIYDILYYLIVNILYNIDIFPPKKQLTLVLRNKRYRVITFNVQ